MTNGFIMTNVMARYLVGIDGLYLLIGGFE
jgi:hypothetical protein